MLEDDLLELCLQGNRMAQEKLYRHYASRMHGICVRYARTGFEVEDIFQEAFVKVFTHLHRFNKQGSLDGWIRRIVVNTAVDSYKKNLLFKEHVSYDTAPDDELATVTLDDNLQETDLLNLLNQLPDGYRLVFNLYAIEGYSHKEIADLLHINEGTSKSHLAKARKYLQHLLFQQQSIRNESRFTQ